MTPTPNPNPTPAPTPAPVVPLPSQSFWHSLGATLLKIAEAAGEDAAIIFLQGLLSKLPQ